MLELRGVSKSYRSSPGVVAVGGISNLNITVGKGTFFTLLGPSGCGKTTTLRCIAGLELPDSGVIAISGDTVFDDANGVAVPVNQRSIGMVFQSYAIWPHMSVFENVAFPLRVDRNRRNSRAEIEKRVGAALETVGLAAYSDRSATQLSGGQQQRLAFARAIINRPNLLLLDEPLSNLDVRLREGMRAELKRLQKEVGLTAIYVTHDQSEALAMSDQIAVLDHGRLVQCGTANEIFYKPENRFVAGFIGAANLLEAEMLGASDSAGVYTARLSDGQLIACTRVREGKSSGTISVCVRPEAIRVLPASASVASDRLNSLRGRIETRTFLGHTMMLQVAAAGCVLQVMASPGDVALADAEVTLQFAAQAALALDH